VIHGTSAIDTVQRFIGKIELGMITSIIDTVIFIDAGKVGKVYELKMVVKVPTGMVEADLARPVIEVRDFLSGALEYEIYTFGEETAVVPVTGEREKKVIPRSKILRTIKKYIGNDDVLIETTGSNKVVIFADETIVPKLIGRNGKTVGDIERELGVSIDVRSIEDRDIGDKKEIKFRMRRSGGNLIISFSKELSGMPVDFYMGNDFIFSATIGKRGEVRLDTSTEVARTITRNIEEGRSLFAKV
jgi:ATPase